MAAPTAVIKAAQAAVKVIFDKKARQKAVSILGGIIMLPLLIVSVFLFLISGILGLFVNAYVKQNWQTIKANIYDVFESVNRTANSAAKEEVYRFMPDFSLNLSKAAVSGSYPDELLIYDTAELTQAKEIMQTAADRLRNAQTADEYREICYEYSISYDEENFSEILGDEAFQNDSGTDKAAEYSAAAYTFLSQSAKNKMNKYDYQFEEYETAEGKKAKKQTLTVTEGNLKKTIEYRAIGETELYLPEFLAMYQVRNYNGIINIEDGEKADKAIENAMGGDFSEAENEEEKQNAVKNINQSNKASAALDLFQIAELSKILQDSLSQGNITSDIDFTEGEDYKKLSITLEAPNDEEWDKVFELDKIKNAAAVKEELESVIVEALTDAGVEESEFYLNLDNFFQDALFVYFKGFFNLPVESSELTENGNGITDKYGDYSKLHTMGPDYLAVIETGVTLSLKNPQTEAKIDLLPAVKSECIEDIVIYDIWLGGEHLGSEYSTGEIKAITYDCDMITLAYTINTKRFEEDYGFTFPAPLFTDEETNELITLLVEYSCLCKSYYADSYQVGKSVKELVKSGDFTLGLCHDGITKAEEEKATSLYYWRRHSKNIPHLGIKTAFLNYPSYEGALNFATDTNVYEGITGKGAYGMQLVNPLLWFKGFRTEAYDENLAGLVGA